MVNRLSVIIAIFPHNDADTVSVASSKESAVESWKNYMTNGDDALLSDPWIVENAVNLLNYGKTERQDSGVFYRLNPMIA